MHIANEVFARVNPWDLVFLAVIFLVTAIALSSWVGMAHKVRRRPQLRRTAPDSVTSLPSTTSESSRGKGAVSSRPCPLVSFVAGGKTELMFEQLVAAGIISALALGFAFDLSARITSHETQFLVGLLASGSVFSALIAFTLPRRRLAGTDAPFTLWATALESSRHIIMVFIVVFLGGALSAPNALSCAPGFLVAVLGVVLLAVVMSEALMLLWVVELVANTLRRAEDEAALCHAVRPVPLLSEDEGERRRKSQLYCMGGGLLGWSIRLGQLDAGGTLWLIILIGGALVAWAMRVFCEHRIWALVEDLFPEGVYWHKKICPDRQIGKRVWSTDSAEPTIVPGDAPRTSMLQPGQMVSSKYRVIEVHRGGLGAVAIAVDVTCGRPVALKTIREDTERSDPAAGRELLKRDAEAWLHLGHHPHLVEAYDLVDMSGRLWLVLEYVAPLDVQTSSLGDYMQRHTINAKQAILWVDEVCAGLEHAYDHGLSCHRDIKPENILLTHTGHAKLTDIGVSAWGTPGYMPPEQVVSRTPQPAGVEVDVYAIGVVLYQLTHCGELPQARRFDRSSDVAVLSPVIKRCLAFHLRNRYSSISALRGDLRRAWGEIRHMEYGGDTPCGNVNPRVVR